MYAIRSYYGYGEGTGDGGRGEAFERSLLGVGDQLDPVVVTGDQRLDLVHRHVLGELDGQRLAVAAHGADAHAEAVDRDLLGGAEDLVGFDQPFPLLAALAVFDLAVDPGEQAAGERVAELGGRDAVAVELGGDLLVDLEDRSYNFV